MRVLFFISFFLIIRLNSFSQNKVKDFEKIEIGNDYKAYIVGTNELADGEFVGCNGKWDRKYYHQNECESIKIISHFVLRDRLIISAKFKNGFPCGTWLMEDCFNNLCGYINFDEGKLNGKCMYQCQYSNKREIMEYQNDFMIYRLIYDKIGDTLLYYNRLHPDLEINKCEGERSEKHGWCDISELF